MGALNFITGGEIELPKDLREKTADTLSKMEQALRKVEEKSEQGKGESSKEE
jgi:hypothetical protein